VTEQFSWLYGSVNSVANTSAKSGARMSSLTWITGETRRSACDVRVFSDVLHFTVRLGMNINW
jgi:hypothetical protein